MRRGRIFIYLALIVIIVVAAVGLYLYTRGQGSQQPPDETQATPQIRYVEIVTAGQNIYPGTTITDDMLSSIQIPDDKLVQGLFTDRNQVVGLYAKYSITQGVPITDAMVSASPGNVNLPGSQWAPFIPQGLTAVAIPITRLSSAAYAIRDGDYVNIIVTMLVADTDPASQTSLPNYLGSLEAGDGGYLKFSQSDVRQGRFELDQITNQVLYILPSEDQRPRLITQMIMQNIQVLHVGSFPLPGEPASDLLIASGPGTTPTPQPADQQQATAPIVRPDIITLMVTPQDAVTLTYLVYNGIEITLTLRNPNDQAPGPQPEAATLEYLLTQYNIPVPAKLPYSLQPGDDLQRPKLPNDPTPMP